MPSDDVKVTWRLEMNDPSQMRPKRAAPSRLDVRQVETPCPEYNWFLHQAVGTPFRWGGREGWTEKEWTDYVMRPELETWVAYLGGAPAGYFELERQPDGSVRIPCFGLLQRTIGKGLGGELLTIAVERAWQCGATRVWLTTCSHDHPHALGNYLARGFQLVEEKSGPPNRQRQPVLFTNT